MNALTARDRELESLKRRILAAKGETPSDLVFKGGKVVNVFTGEILERDVAVMEGVVVGLGSGYRGREEVDAAGKWIVPGLIDAHVHIESSMLLPAAFAASVVVHGTTTVVSDPHEIANVRGLEGVRFMLRNSRSAPVDIFFTAPSCVPATPLETSGARLGASDLASLRSESRILGLGEVMNYPGVLNGDRDLLEKIHLFRGKLLDGHSPLLRGLGLQAYLSTGICSDHEVSDPAEALEKIQSGMTVMIREGTSARNLSDLLPLVTPTNSRRFCIVSDDLHPRDLLNRGHLDHVLRKAVQGGLDPVLAIQLTTLNPAEYLGLKDRGAVSAGHRADLVLLDDLESFSVSSVYKDGRLKGEGGKLVDAAPGGGRRSEFASQPFPLAHVRPESFRIRHCGPRARVIELIPGQIITRSRVEEMRSVEGWVQSDLQRDLLKIAVIERHAGTGRMGVGLVRGFGLKQGAIASSVAHDSHNVIVVGVRDEEIFRAVREVGMMGGGFAAVAGEETLARVPLPIAGLMSGEPLPALVGSLETLAGAVRRMGCPLEEPFMALSFLALPAVPEIKLTDWGLVDVGKFEIVSLFE